MHFSTKTSTSFNSSLLSLSIHAAFQGRNLPVEATLVHSLLQNQLDLLKQLKKGMPSFHEKTCLGNYLQ